MRGLIDHKRVPCCGKRVTSHASLREVYIWAHLEMGPLGIGPYIVIGCARSHLSNLWLASWGPSLDWTTQVRKISASPTCGQNFISIRSFEPPNSGPKFTIFLKSFLRCFFFYFFFRAFNLMVGLIQVGFKPLGTGDIQGPPRFKVLDG